MTIYWMFGVSRDSKITCLDDLRNQGIDISSNKLKWGKNIGREAKAKDKKI